MFKSHLTISPLFQIYKIPNLISSRPSVLFDLEKSKSYHVPDDSENSDSHKNFFDTPSTTPRQAFYRVMKAQSKVLGEDHLARDKSREAAYSYFRSPIEESKLKMALLEADEAAEFLQCGIIQATKIDGDEDSAFRVRLTEHHTQESPFHINAAEEHKKNPFGGCKPSEDNACPVPNP